MLKVVLDTSIFVAALKSQSESSTSKKILNIWRQGHFSLVMSPQLLNELIYILTEKFNFSDEVMERLVADIELIAFHIDGTYATNFLDQIDQKDNILLAAAYQAKTDYLVSLDKQHILPIKYFHGTQILNPYLFVRQLEQLQS